MKNIYVVSMLVLVSGLANAAAGQSVDLNIDKVLSGYSHNGIFLETSENIPNSANCSNSAGSPRLIAVIPDHNNVDHVLSLALAAQISKSLVDIQVLEDICFQGWPVMRRIRLK